jgi:hypothetical protein
MHKKFEKVYACLKSQHNWVVFLSKPLLFLFFLHRTAALVVVTVGQIVLRNLFPGLMVKSKA